MKSLFYAPTSKTVFQAKDKTNELAITARTLEGYNINLKTDNLTITIDQYQQLGDELTKLKLVKGSQLDIIRNALLASLETLMATVGLLARYGNLLTNFEKTLAQARILDSTEAVQAYLKQIRVSLFPDAVVQVQKVQIRQEYALYIKRYGPPPNGLFNVRLLARIMAEI
jgi:hypothetical protein